MEWGHIAEKVHFYIGAPLDFFLGAVSGILKYAFLNYYLLFWHTIIQNGSKELTSTLLNLQATSMIDRKTLLATTARNISIQRIHNRQLRLITPR